MVAGLFHRRVGAWLGGNDPANDAVAIPELSQAVHMKSFSVLLLTLALLFRAELPCAGALLEQSTEMSAGADCSMVDHADHRGKNPDRGVPDQGRACHACALPALPSSDASAVWSFIGAPIQAAQQAQADGQHLKPPIPPPRAV